MRKQCRQAVFAVFCLMGMGTAVSGKSLESPSKDTIPQKRQVLRLNLRHPIHSLNPFHLKSVEAHQVLRWILPNLVEINPQTGQRAPRLAKKWTLSKDKKRVIIDLQPDLTWHDGHRLTADDILFTFKALKQPKYEAAVMAHQYKLVEKVEVKSPQRAVFYLKKPDYETLTSILHFRVLPRHFYESTPSQQWSYRLLGAGPYQLDKFSRGKEIVLAQVDQRHSRSSFSKVHFIPIESPRVGFSKVGSSQLDFFTFDQINDWKKLKKQKTKKDAYSVTRYRPAQYSRHLMGAFNLKNPIFKDKAVRQALNQLFPSRLINEKIYEGQLEPAKHPWPHNVPWAPRLRAHRFSADKALALLRRLGWRDHNKDGVLEKKSNGKVTQLRFSITYYQKSIEPSLSLYRQELLKRGIAVDLHPVARDNLLKVLTKKSFDVLFSKEPAAPVILSSMFHSKGSYNSQSYNNATVDTLLDQLSMTFGQEKREQTMKQIAQIIAEDQIFILGLSNPWKYYVSRKKLNVPINSLNYRLGLELWNWQIR